MGRYSPKVNDAGAIRPLQPAVMSARDRAVSLLVSAGCLAVLLVAAWLEPDRRGVGSHERLGLSPCGFLKRTGLPCGTCGMTTSFALFADGRLAASFHTQPFGLGLAFATAMAFWAALYCGVTGRPSYRLLRRLPLGWLFGLILAFWLASWGWKMWNVLQDSSIGATGR